MATEELSNIVTTAHGTYNGTIIKMATQITAVLADIGKRLEALENVRVPVQDVPPKVSKPTTPKKVSPAKLPGPKDNGTK